MSLQFFKKYWFLTSYVVVSLGCFLSVFISPKLFWPAVFASYAIPVFLVLAFLLLPILFLIRRPLVIFPFIVVVSGIPFMLMSVALNFDSKNDTGQNISVLSFNAKLFRKWKTYESFSTETIEWAVRDSSDVKCFQEYSTNARWKALDVTGQMSDYQHFIYKAELGGEDHSPGMAIFSKLPIVDSGYVWRKPWTTNAGMFVDLLKGEDTIRVYNVHLESMYLKLYQYKQLDHMLDKVQYMIEQLKDGAQKRSEQLSLITEHTSQCPYPFVICGDFNETPYSYNYLKMRSRYHNSFEEVGSGFGFTFNSVLFFLRIDHHFTGGRIEPMSFTVDRSVGTSDHFPTRGVYGLLFQ